ncbi:CBS domain-containing protein [Sulfurisphaera ohwakuensis]|uniref:CBS domain-containing protein n=1 Tax=Sulfurisphaera ohwakuensis TaxID=69656 RepID=A0A650CI03_SULOH|nr:CBS domain-containing protein [Sulfurisphaera ohwakuensis]MBB5253836.1 signal-transduction protein with cAMP-binding, CBS, and nucleotidyltransferase domain [Sulfurisphaera ohwakuensis]QGR17491.1 CBS domain-containing protein [Sulfurisphaera ohwakuensis]
MLIGQLITKNLVSLPSNSTIKEVADMMIKENVGSVVLKDGDKITGIVTERDIVNAVHRGLSLNSPAIEIASTNLIRIDYNKSIYDAFYLMTRNNIRHLIIEKDGKCVGVISIRDVAKAFSLMIAEQMSY